MYLHEWSLGGVYVSPLLIYCLSALVPTALSLWLLQWSGLARYLWHDTLFACALFVLWLAGIVGLLAT